LSQTGKKTLEYDMRDMLEADVTKPTAVAGQLATAINWPVTTPWVGHQLQSVKHAKRQLDTDSGD
jgi:hypothetical protein